MEKIFVPVVLGTARPGRLSEKVARFVLEVAEDYGFRTEFIDVAEFELNRTDQSVPPPKWQQVAAQADGFIIVAPEYNHGVPGELKILLDSLSKEYEHKPLAICSVSSGGFGGSRMVMNLQLIALELGLIPVNQPVAFSRVQDLFDEGGKIKGPGYQNRLFRLFDELKWFVLRLESTKDKS